jgi:hypothetical protein
MDLKNPEANHFVNFYPFFLAVDIVWLFFSALILGLFGVGVANSIENAKKEAFNSQKLHPAKSAVPIGNPQEKPSGKK